MKDLINRVEKLEEEFRDLDAKILNLELEQKKTKVINNGKNIR